MRSTDTVAPPRHTVHSLVLGPVVTNIHNKHTAYIHTWLLPLADRDRRGREEGGKREGRGREEGRGPLSHCYRNTLDQKKKRHTNRHLLNACSCRRKGLLGSDLRALACDGVGDDVLVEDLSLTEIKTNT